MKSTFDLLQGELERLFDLEAMMRLSTRLLGFDPEEVGGTQSKGTFARALVTRCAEDEALAALADAIVLSAPDADARLKNGSVSWTNGDLKPGTNVSGLRVVRKLGEGGLGIVYLAERDNADPAQVALKVIRPEYARDRSAVRRFQTAARVVQDLSAPGLVPIVGVGQLDDARPWVAAQYVEGHSLADHIEREGPLHFNEARPVFVDVLNALEALHDRGLVHGDVKTENVLAVREPGDDGRPLLRGRLVDAATDRLLTRTKFNAGATGCLPVLGTAKAMSPEQARGTPDARSDIYSVGVLMYETLTGRPPFEGQSAIEIIAQHLSAQPRAPSEVARPGWITPEIDAIVLRALAKNPAERFQSAAELLRELERFLRASMRPPDPLDTQKFESAAQALKDSPRNAELANALENLGRAAATWQPLIDALLEAAQAAGDDGAARVSLLLRAARIAEVDMFDHGRAAELYAQALELDSNNQVAVNGIISSRQAADDVEGLLDFLLDRVENEHSVAGRVQLLARAAVLYETKLDDRDNALVAWLQVLCDDPGDERARREVERLARGSQQRWQEAVEGLAAAVQERQSALQQAGAQAGSEEPSAELQAARDEAQKTLDAVLEQYRQHADEVEQLERNCEQQRERLTELKDAADKTLQKAEQLADQAEAAGEQEVGEELQQALDAATSADEQAEEQERLVQGLEEQIQHSRSALTQQEEQVSAARERLAQIDSELESAPKAPDAEPDDPERQREELVQLYLLMGSWYSDHLNALDAAQQCFGQVLALDPANEQAFEGLADVYRFSQSWAELVSVLLQHAEASASPVRGRDFRAQAAVVLADKLGDVERAQSYFERVLQEDPAHPGAQRTLERILSERGDTPALLELLKARADGQHGGDKLQTLNRIAELYEDQLDDLDHAREYYEAAAELEPRDLTALKGLERIYARKQDIAALLANLKAQLEHVATAKQRIALLERIGATQEEEFVDRPAAIESFEKIVAIDPGHEGANVALTRLYRHQKRFEELVETLQRHAHACDDPARKIESLLGAVHVLMGELDRPLDATPLCEQILAIEPEHAGALGCLARLRSTAGDLDSAVEATERLARRTEDPKKRAELLAEAGELLRQAGSMDAAVERYKGALDADAAQQDAANALRRIYEERGDLYGAIEMLQHAIGHAEGSMGLARLHADLGRLQRSVGEHEAARANFERALELDGTCNDAAVGLGRYAYEGERYLMAVEHFTPVLGRLGELEPTEAREVSLLAADAAEQAGEPERARQALAAASELLPDDVALCEKLADTLLQMERGADARNVLHGLLDRIGEQLPLDEQLRLTKRLARAQMTAGEAEQAIATLQALRASRPDDEEVLAALTDTYGAAGKWDEVLSLLQLRARGASDERKAELLVKSGDVFLNHLKDMDAAASTYMSALDLQPNNRNLLTKLMAVYSEAKDWSRLIDVLWRMSELVDEPTQRAKYYGTAARIAHEELGRFGEAADYYEKALGEHPGLQSALDGLVQCLTQNQDWNRLEELYQREATRMLGSDAPVAEIARVLDRRAEILHQRLGRVEEAAQVYGQAKEMDPDNEARNETLTAIYMKEPQRFYREAVQAHRDLLAANPYRTESYQALRKIFTNAKQADAAWCACQVLVSLGMAAPDEQRFFSRYRTTSLAKIRHPMNDSHFESQVAHPAQDRELTALFAAMAPAVVASEGQSLSALGVSEQDRLQPAQDTTAIGRMLAYVEAHTSLHLPEVYKRPQDPGGLSFLLTKPPAVGVGQGALAGGPAQALAFIAGRHLTYYHAAYAMRQFVPTGTGLRAWLLAAIRLMTPKFPVPGTLNDQVEHCQRALQQHLNGAQRDHARSLADKLVASKAEIDLKRWAASIDLTADRLGFVLSNDLKLTKAVIEASPGEASVLTAEERVRELLTYSVSEPYLDLRAQLGLALSMK